MRIDEGLCCWAQPTREKRIADGPDLDCYKPVRVRIVESTELRKIMDELAQLREIAEAAAAAMSHANHESVRYCREQLLLDLLKEWEK
jgi:hypothetical protein